MRETLRSFGELIRQRRILMGLLQPDLSALTGINVRTIQLLEQGKGNPTIETLLKLTEALGLVLDLSVKQAGKNYKA
jgi:transcriptional regulator with XRE-family HTH domain